jgi:hypothetical protein
MSRWFALLILHVAQVVLASTSFTIVTGMHDGRFGWQYLMYHRQTGWGLPYEFPYTLPVVLTYVAAYGTGLVVYFLAFANGSRIIAATGIVLCGLGLVSFLYELTHWMNDHYASWIVSAPGAILLWAVLAGVQYYQLARRGQESYANG